VRTEQTIRLELTTVQVLALTLWAEARNQGQLGLEAVGSVIRNRSNQPGWWGRSIIAVCLTPWQFSCWNPGKDVNHLRLLGQADRMLDGLPVSQLDRKMAQCLLVANGIVDGTIPDRVNGCDHYFSPTGMIPKGSLPRWAKDPVTQLPIPPDVIVGDHWFYRLGPDGRHDLPPLKSPAEPGGPAG
jgi:hypothetical protein